MLLESGIVSGGTPMLFSRRSFMMWAASMSMVAPGSRAEWRSVLATDPGFRPSLLPSQKEIWDNLLWMARLGPKYTGNNAHTTFVEWLATRMQSLGLDVARDRYTLPRWEAKRWAITVTPATGG